MDSLKIVRVLSNILSNASEAMNRKGKIWIHSKDVVVKNTPFVELCVGNNGSYIEPENIQNLFEAFYTKNKSGGTGLGLAIAKKIIQSHGGNIRCESSKDLGVEFYFTLPIESGKIYNVEVDLPAFSQQITSST